MELEQFHGAKCANGPKASPTTVQAIPLATRIHSIDKEGAASKPWITYHACGINMPIGTQLNAPGAQV